MLDRYVQLLEAAAREPEVPVGKLLMTMRWDDVIAELVGDDRP